MQRFHFFLDGILGAATLGLIGLLAFLSWQHERYLSSPLRIVLLIGTAAIAAIGLMAAFRLDRERRASLTLALVSIGLSLYLAEVLLTYLPSWIARHSLPADFDRRSLFQVVADLRRSGDSAYPAYHPGTVPQPRLAIGGETIVPFSGVREAVTVLCNESGRYVVYRSDEYGFNNPPGLWGKPLSVAFIGDSFVQGECVESGESFVDRFRARVPATLNVGSSGSGPIIEYGFFREYVSQVHPRIVVWCFFENDMGDLTFEARNELFARYLRDSTYTQRLMERRDEIDRALRAYVDEMFQLRAKGLLPEEEPTLSRDSLEDIARLKSLRRLLGLHFTEEFDPRNAAYPGWEVLFRDILTRVRDETAAWGGSLYFVYLPSYESFTSQRTKYRLMNERIVRVAEGLGLPVVDLRPVFLAHGDPPALFPFRRHNHYTSEGNLLIARTLLARILPPTPVSADSTPRSFEYLGAGR